MRVENHIINVYNDLIGEGKIDIEFIELYESIKNEKLRHVFSSLHKQFILLFKAMNSRLPTHDFSAHFWANESRGLISTIEISSSLCRTLKKSEHAFSIDAYYLEIMEKCATFLSHSGGSTIPPNMPKIDLYYISPIFISSLSIKISKDNGLKYSEIKPIGEGSYAQVFKYRDDFYNKSFALKRARKDLTPKERERFKREFEQLKKLSSPYIVEVHTYFDETSEYLMELMDTSLHSYIRKHNSNVTKERRKSICLQVLKGFQYLHSKNLVHRDISPANILVKEYEDTIVIKISDFGLVKIPESNLTTPSTEFKGSFNDPSLHLDGFDNYTILHEVYALTKVLFFVLTGKTNTADIQEDKLRAFIHKGIHPNKNERYCSVEEIVRAFQFYMKT